MAEFQVFGSHLSIVSTPHLRSHLIIFIFDYTKLERDIDEEAAGSICKMLKEFEPISHLHFDVCFNWDLIFGSKIFNEKGAL